MLQSSAAMITFALFMIRDIYCKLNLLEGNDLLQQRILDLIYSPTVASTSEIEPFGSAFHSIITEQKLCQSKAGKKLPAWITHRCLFAPVPLEQCTSQQVAEAKAALFPAETLLDLTGGLGSDDVAWAMQGTRVTSVDPDRALNAIFRFNAGRLGLTHAERLDDTAAQFLSNCGRKFDLVYTDPDRRAGGQRMSTDARNYSPDIFALIDTYAETADRWLIKLSPMTDITWALRQTGENTRVYLFSVKNELKEMLLETGHGVTPGISLIHITDQGHEVITAADVKPAGQSDETLFFEATPAAIKSRFNRLLAANCGLTAETAAETFFTGHHEPHPALVRKFILKQILQGSLSHIAAQLRALNIHKANVAVRESVSSSEETRKILKLADGGEVYLFITGKGKEKRCFVCTKS